MKLRAVLFDLDGVLVDSYALWFHLLNAVARKLRYPAISREMFASNWGQAIEADVHLENLEQVVELVDRAA